MKFQLYKPDGNFIIKDADTVTSEYVEVELDEQTTASAGVGYADLKLTSNGVVIYTCHVSITIDTPVATDETIVSLSMIDGYVFPDDFQLKLNAGTGIYFTGEDNLTINATTLPVVEGDGITIDGNVISVDSEVLSKVAEVDGKQNTLNAGAGISIENDTISATNEGILSHTFTATTSGYGYVRIPITDGTNSILPDNIVSAVSVSDSETWDSNEPIINGILEGYSGGQRVAWVHFIIGYTGQNLANYPVKIRVFFKPTYANLTAEEHRVGEGGNE